MADRKGRDGEDPKPGTLRTRRWRVEQERGRRSFKFYGDPDDLLQYLIEKGAVGWTPEMAHEDLEAALQDFFDHELGWM